MKLEDILLSDNVIKTINDNLDYLLDLMPELKSMIGFKHNHPHHHLDVWNHTLLAISLSKKDFDIRLVLLLHDMGKPFSYQDEEVRHFRIHPKVSADMSYEILKRLRYDEEYINYICDLILNHDRLINKEQIENDYDKCLKLYEIQKCDALAHHPEHIDKRIKLLKETYLELESKRR